MKRIALLLIVGATACWASYAGYLHSHAWSDADSLESQLCWIKSELRLTDAQYQRIRELHQASHPELQAMAQQVVKMHAEFQEFEQLRRTSDRVDFVEFARFVESRRALDKACLDSTRRLVNASVKVMTPEQREQYLHLLAKAEPVVGALIN